MLKKLLLTIMALTMTACATVDTGYRGVVLTWGKPTGEIKTEGISFLMPFTGYDVIPMNVQTQALHVKSAASTKDLQTVDAEETVNFHLDPSKVIQIYDSLRNDYEGRIIAPTIQEAVKAATAQHNAPDLLAHRAIVRDQIEQSLAAHLKPYGILVDQVLITNFSFNGDYQAAVEKKVAAQQEAQTAVIQAQQKADVAIREATAAVAQARGQSQAQELQRSTISAALIHMKMIEKWDGHFPQYMTGGSSPFLMLTKQGSGD